MCNCYECVTLEDGQEMSDSEVEIHGGSKFGFPKTYQAVWCFN